MISKEMMSKAQNAIEYLVIFGVVILLILILIFVFGNS